MTFLYGMGLRKFHVRYMNGLKSILIFFFNSAKFYYVMGLLPMKGASKHLLHWTHNVFYSYGQSSTSNSLHSFYNVVLFSSCKDNTFFQPWPYRKSARWHVLHCGPRDTKFSCRCPFRHFLFNCYHQVLRVIAAKLPRRHAKCLTNKIKW